MSELVRAELGTARGLCLFITRARSPSPPRSFTKLIIVTLLPVLLLLASKSQMLSWDLTYCN